MKRIIIIITALIFLGCSPDPYEEYDIANKQSANNIFEPYLNQFKEEAAKRGHDFSDYEIEFYLADINGKSLGGLAIYNQIFIDRDYWYEINSNLKEFLIFHELGHSILNRKHSNKQTENGECTSFMRSRTDSNTCQPYYYSDLWREFYFDELFDESNSLPIWYTFNNVYNVDYEDKEFLIRELDIDSGSFQMNIDTDTISNFVLEVTFKKWQSASQRDPFPNTKINLNGINYESNPNVNTIYISNSDYSKRYFSKGDYSYEEDIKFTIRRINGIYSFFIDEDYVHVTDINHLETESLNVNFSPGINMDIVLLELD